MAEPPRKRPVHNAGAFYDPGGFAPIAVPMSTLSDEYHDEPAEPEEEQEPAPEPLSLARRFIDLLARRSRTH